MAQEENKNSRRANENGREHKLKQKRGKEQTFIFPQEIASHNADYRRCRYRYPPLSGRGLRTLQRMLLIDSEYA